MTRIKTLLMGIGMALTMPCLALADSIPGKQIVMTGTAAGTPPCSACHGDHLQGNPAFKAPAIAGRNADFILARLAHYAGPASHNLQMKQVATSLNPAQRRAVADYIASVKP